MKIRTTLLVLFILLVAVARGGEAPQPIPPIADPTVKLGLPQKPGPADPGDEGEPPAPPKLHPNDLAINDLNTRIRNAKVGEIIILPSGTYNVDSDQTFAIHGKHGLTIKGEGKVSLLSRNPESQIIDVKDSSDVVIEGFTVYHDVNVSCVATCVSID